MPAMRLKYLFPAELWRRRRTVLRFHEAILSDNVRTLWNRPSSNYADDQFSRQFIETRSWFLDWTLGRFWTCSVENVGWREKCARRWINIRFDENTCKESSCSSSIRTHAWTGRAREKFSKIRRQLHVSRISEAARRKAALCSLASSPRAVSALAVSITGPGEVVYG